MKYLFGVLILMVGFSLILSVGLYFLRPDKVGNKSFGTIFGEQFGQLFGYMMIILLFIWVSSWFS